MYYLGLFLGALAITFVLIRFVTWLLRRLGQDRLGIAHLVVAVVATLISAYGFADGGDPQFLFGAAIYGSATLIWFVIDLILSRRE
jgi:hypothetical protein